MNIRRFDASLLARSRLALSLLAALVLSAAWPPPQGASAQDDDGRAAAAAGRAPSSQRTSPAAAAPPPEEEIGEVERIDAELTNVLLTATDENRRFVKTLRAEDVRLLEDGVPQTLLAFERETNAPLSLSLLIDVSASQAGVLAQEQRAARRFVESVLRPDTDDASVISFTGIARIEQPLTGDLSRLYEAIDRTKVEYTMDSPECNDEKVPEELKLRCYTGVWDSIVVAVRESLARTPEQTRRAVVLLSDGDDTSSRARIYHAAEEAVRNNVAVYSIGIRDRDFKHGRMRRDYLMRIAEETGGRAFFPEDAEDLAAAFRQIEDELRSQYLVSYRPSNRARDGAFRRVEIEVTNPKLRKGKLRLLYRRGYFAKRPAPAPSANATPSP